MMYVKIHKSEHSEITAVCDEELLGKTLTQGENELEIAEDFYKGELKNKDEVIELLKISSNANLVGDEAISCGLDAKIIAEDHIIVIGGVKHAQFYSLE